MTDSKFNLTAIEAEAIARLSVLEQLREQARQSNRAAMLSNIESLIESELRAIQRIRNDKVADGPDSRAEAAPGPQ